MIDFEEELKHFQPSDEIEDAEAAIYEHDYGYDGYYAADDE